MPFYKIRRYVSRASCRIGCRGDSPPEPDEHLMIVFHDLLTWDGHVNISYTYEQRRQRLRKLVSLVRGHAAIRHRTLLDLVIKGGERRLASEMAYALSQ